MFSSLPSAGKIYVSSAKSKQKNVYSARRKRKKSDSRNEVDKHITDETLISLAAETESPVSNSHDVSALNIHEKKRTMEFKVTKIRDIRDDNSNPSNERAIQREFEVSSDYDPYGIADQGVPATNNYIEIAIGSDDSDGEIESNLSCVVASVKITENSGIMAKTDEIGETFSDDISQKHVIHSDEDSANSNDEELELSANKFVSLKSSRSCSLTSVSSLPKSEAQNVERSYIKETHNIEPSLYSDNISMDKQFESFTKENYNSNSVDNNTLPDVSDNSMHEKMCNTISKYDTEKCLDLPKTDSKENKPDAHIVLQNTVLVDKKENELINIKSNSDLNDQTTDLKKGNNPQHSMEEGINNYIDETLSLQDYSEQNSCTESGDFSITNDNSPVDVAATQSTVEATTSINSTVETSHLNTAKNFAVHSSNIKRSHSLPSDIFKLNEYCLQSKYNKKSDKATMISDTFISNSSKREEEKKHLKCVASGDDLPVNNKLPILTMMKARMRNYVFGCKGTEGSLLGSEELNRFFPQNKVTIFVGTWNMNGHDAPDNINDFLLPLSTNSVPDIYAVGVQESMQSKSEWELLLQTTLGPSHVLFTSSSLGVLHLAIFIRRDLIWFCSEPEDGSIATRVGSMVKTKGAVAVCFMLFGSSFLFVNSHLTAHEQNLMDRISDYEKICAGLYLPRSIPLKSGHNNKNITSKFDNVFWCGDLNFRINWTRPAVMQILKEKFQEDCKSSNLLMDHDQLQKAIKEGVAFHDFKEGVINFNPSFKFDVGTSMFDSVKQRVPSYTDRILYRCKDSASIQCLHYNCVTELVTSDHKPVFAIFSVSLKPGRDSIPLAAGIFKRDVYLEALRRRAKFLEVNHNQKQSTICNVM